jgi:hypothetical protein
MAKSSTGFYVVIATLVSVLAIGLSLIIMNSFLLVNRSKLDPKCDESDNVCKVGISTLLPDNTKVCETRYRPTGASCKDQCHVDGAKTTCTQDHACVSAEPTDCLGTCVITDFSLPIMQAQHPDCTDKLTFYDAYVWGHDNRLSSPNLLLTYSNYGGDCTPEVGCLFYATRLQLETDATNTTNWITDLVHYDCLQFLNMTNTECIEAITVPLDANISTTYWQAVLGGSNKIKYQSDVCLYYYKCHQANTTALLDPANLAKKRSTSSAQEQVRAWNANTAPRFSPYELALNAMDRGYDDMVRTMKPVFEAEMAKRDKRRGMSRV